MLMFLSNMSQGVLLHLDVALLGTIMVSCFLVQLISSGFGFRNQEAWHQLQLTHLERPGSGKDH
jgi:hypothetical protein